MQRATRTARHRIAGFLGAGLALLLAVGDEVYVPTFEDHLVVIGAVPNPGPRPFRPGQSVREFFIPTRPLAALLGAGALVTLLAAGTAAAVEPVGAGRVAITGPSGRSNEHVLQPGTTLEDLILVAGKLELVGDLSRIELRRAGEPVHLIDLPGFWRSGGRSAIRLQAGDEIYVPALKDSLMLLGALENPGPRPVRPGQTVREFLTMNADLMARPTAGPAIQRVQLLRAGQEPLTIELREVLRRRDHPSNVPLRSGDILFVAPRR